MAASGLVAGGCGASVAGGVVARGGGAIGSPLPDGLPSRDVSSLLLSPSSDEGVSGAVTVLARL